MKLKNKNTGEIEEVEIRTNKYNRITIVGKMEDGITDVVIKGYNSITELVEDYEDYEEPKDFYHIGEDGDIKKYPVVVYNDFDLRKLKQIGNYFETKEEAEKAVEKLKAWKRVNEAGLKIDVENVSDIDSITDGYVDFDLHCYFKRYDGFGEDMDTLFGGEE